MKIRIDRKRILQGIAFALTIAAALVVLLVPGYTEMRLTNEGPAQVKALTLAIFTVVGSASIGWFYLPATIVAFIALISPSSDGQTLSAHPASSH